MRYLSIKVENRGLLEAIEKGLKLLEKYMGQAVFRSVQMMAREAKTKHAPKAHSTLVDAINHRWSRANPLTGEVVAGTNYARMVE